MANDLSYDDVTLPAGCFAKGEVKFQLASLMYDFAVIDTPGFGVGLQLGAEWAKLQGEVYAEAGNDSFRARSSDVRRLRLVQAGRGKERQRWSAGPGPAIQRPYRGREPGILIGQQQIARRCCAGQAGTERRGASFR